MSSTWFDNIGLCITDKTRSIIQNLNSIGMPTPIIVLDGLHTFINPVKKMQCIKLHQRYFNSVLPKEALVFALDNTNQTNTHALLRHMQECKRRILNWREMKPYVLLEDMRYDQNTKELLCTGYLRGSNLSANQLVHITNHGTFQLKQITILPDPNPWKANSLQKEVMHDISTQEQESLQALKENMENHDNIILTKDQEKQWLLDNMDPQIVKQQVPAGVSEYQASWYDDEILKDIQNEIELNNTEIENESNNHLETTSVHTGITDTQLLSMKDIIRHEQQTDEERIKELNELREMSQEELHHPDVVDTPYSIPARHRFSKYRGLNNFQTSAWDTNENLPQSYSNIYKLQGYAKWREYAFHQYIGSLATPGSYVSFIIKDVPASVEQCATDIMIVSGLLCQEQKWSMLHFQLTRNSEYTESIKSKTLMLAHVGFRKFFVQPIFSDISAGDRTKYSKFFHENEKFRLCSFFGPITYHPAPILLFSVGTSLDILSNVPQSLLCYGNAAPPNPDLLILKRIVLQGRIATIFRKSLIVKHMFFNDIDVRWFKPNQLYTKFGKRGKIMKSIGTHGLFRATFNDQVMQHDVIYMDLYKRVFPRFNTVEYNIGTIKDLYEKHYHKSDFSDSDD